MPSGALLFPGHRLEATDPLNIDNYEYIQPLTSATWSIPHGLGYKPSVTIFDNSNNEIFGDVVYDDDDNITITFSSAVIGKAYLS